MHHNIEVLTRAHQRAMAVDLPPAGPSIIVRAQGVDS
jgi:hypothetical protein